MTLGALNLAIMTHYDCGFLGKGSGIFISSLGRRLLREYGMPQRIVSRGYHDTMTYCDTPLHTPNMQTWPRIVHPNNILIRKGSNLRRVSALDRFISIIVIIMSLSTCPMELFWHQWWQFLLRPLHGYNAPLTRSKGFISGFPPFIAVLMPKGIYT